MRPLQKYPDRVLPAESHPGDPVAHETLELLETYFESDTHADLLSLIAVITDIRPAAWLDIPPDTTQEEFANLLDVLPVEHRPAPVDSGRVIATDSARFELLPDAGATRDAFDLQIGLFLGYPHDAIVQFVRADGPTTAEGDVLVKRGDLNPGDFAYTQFVPWVRRLSVDNLERQIADGKALAHRLFDVSTDCTTDRIAELVADAYHTKRQALAENVPEPAPDESRPEHDELFVAGSDDRLQLDLVGVHA